MRLAIGAVQFGLDYGVSNTAGKTHPDEAARILSRARLTGIDTLDTAAAYGDSEQVLGNVGVGNWKIVTKVPPLPGDHVDGKEWVLSHVRQSLSRLQVDRLDGLLLHNPADILRSQGVNIAAGLMKAKADGLVEKVGYSIYSPQLLPNLLRAMTPDLVQAPFSIFDQRLVKSGWLGRLSDSGIEVHTRSIFLQGLLLMQQRLRPVYFERWASLWQQWDSLVDEYGGSELTVCIGFTKAKTGISRIIVGVENLQHLEELITIWPDAPTIEGAGLSCNDPQLIEPSNWKLK